MVSKKAKIIGAGAGITGLAELITSNNITSGIVYSQTFPNGVTRYFIDSDSSRFLVPRGVDLSQYVGDRINVVYGQVDPTGVLTTIAYLASLAPLAISLVAAYLSGRKQAKEIIDQAQELGQIIYQPQEQEQITEA